MSFIKFWVAFMGFFFFSIVPWVLRLRQLFLLLMCKRKEQLYKCRYSEAALHVFMWRIWDHSWYRSLKTACPCVWEMCKWMVNDWPWRYWFTRNIVPEKELYKYWGFFLAFSLAKVMELLSLHISHSAWKLPIIKQKKNEVCFLVIKKKKIFSLWPLWQWNKFLWKRSVEHK